MTNLPFARLEAYRQARVLLDCVREANISEPRLRDQAMRAATSVCLNISEGAGRDSWAEGGNVIEERPGMGRIVFLTLLSAAVSCVSIDGGAVEASWVVRTDDGRAITDCQCSDPRIASVRFELEGASGAVKGALPCQGRTSCEFSCIQNPLTGVRLSAGRY